jgi:protein arginine kinase
MADRPDQFSEGTEWLRGEGEAVDVVMSSRVRLARNLAGFPFMSGASPTDAQQTLDLCRKQILASGLGERIIWFNLHESPPAERTLLMERHLISAQHVRGKQANGSGGTDTPRGVAVALPSERLSIMINEEDHLRIQIVRSGLALTDAFEDIDRVDDELESGLDMAYSSRFGYLTACPTNVGTGIRVSLMLHLPGLVITGEIEKAQRAARDMSLAVRGFYGEGSEAAGDFFQVSNQTTLGKSDEVILHEFQHEIIPKIIEYERASRRKLMDKRRSLLEDRVFRALGQLRHARLMSAEESMQLLSQVRLGVVLGLIEGIDQQTVTPLMLLTQPAHLQRVLGRQLTQSQRRVERATLLRDRLSVG